MKALRVVILLTLALVFSANHDAFALDDKRHAVTITNLGRGQLIVQPVVISHNKNFELLSRGSPVLEQLTVLAREGDAAPLMLKAVALPSVYEATASSRMLVPGSSVVLEVNTNSAFQLISVTGMLANMKNAVFAAQGVMAPDEGERVVEAVIYHSGQETGEGPATAPGPEHDGVRGIAGPKKLFLISSPVIPAPVPDMTVPEKNNPIVEITVRPVH